MRLNPIFVILGFMYAKYAVPLPDSPVSIAQRNTAQPLNIVIQIKFQNGVETTSAEAKTEEAQGYADDIRKRVVGLMNSAFHSGIHNHQLKGAGYPYDKLAPPYTLRYIWDNYILIILEMVKYKRAKQRDLLKDWDILQ
ncbi:hypothetical protein BDP27DRAFT_1493730 [Rhodocollybia butyracea]|uniref:Uncharacterized protein n=1 Tax=Rhodocollybia butyracea TaxID=206335 RepID=A0A9P5Q052_9AGAR|nr:hypothetical protein BDP27DRAFT_1493721 [Rhodocollybia butyracea]KAF9072240.1 hypothetical protein BDP27DRAFT_1493730 [Rhodocollybia butyracea]